MDKQQQISSSWQSAASDRVSPLKQGTSGRVIHICNAIRYKRMRRLVVEGCVQPDIYLAAG